MYSHILTLDIHTSPPTKSRLMPKLINELINFDSLSIFIPKPITLFTDAANGNQKFKYALRDLRKFLKQSPIISPIIVFHTLTFKIQHSYYLSKIRLTSLTIQAQQFDSAAIKNLATFESLSELSLVYTSNGNADKLLKKLATLKFKPSLSKLHLKGFNICDSTILKILNNNPHINILNLFHSTLTVQGAKFLVFANIDELTIDASSDFTEPNAIVILSKSRAIKSFQFYSDVELSECDEDTNPNLVTGLAIANWTNNGLKKLSLCGTQLDKKTIKALALCNTLQTLTLDNIIYDHNEFEINPTQAVSLHAGSIYMHEHGEQKLTLLLNNPNLQYLTLKNASDSLCDYFLPDYFTHALSELPHLRYLNLDGIAFKPNDDQFEAFIDALSSVNSIQDLRLCFIHTKHLHKLAKLSKLQSLVIGNIDFKFNPNKIDLQSASNINWGEIADFVNKNQTLIDFRFTDIHSPYGTNFPPPTNNAIAEIYAALRRNNEKKSHDLQQYINRCNQFIQGWFDTGSFIAKLPKELITLILYQYAQIEDLVWKSAKQRIGLVECLAAGIFKFTQTSYQSKPIKIIEKHQYGENTFSLFFKPLPTKTRSNDDVAATINSPQPIKYLRAS